MLVQPLSKVLPYTVEQLFDLVADVEQYQHFLPFWTEARVRRINDHLYYTDQVLELNLIHIRFTTQTSLNRPLWIKVTSNEAMFQTMQIQWKFEDNGRNQCRVKLVVDIKVTSRTFQKLLNMLLSEMNHHLMIAFEKRAHSIYGQSDLASGFLNCSRVTSPARTYELQLGNVVAE